MSRALRKLDKWLEAGLINQSQKEAILSFEKSQVKTTLLQKFTYVGVFAIICGVLSLVAANWFSIPDHVKLGVHFLMNIGVSIALYKKTFTQKNTLREALLLGLFGLNLTFIALIGQIFHLDGDMASALLLWLAVSSPAIFIIGRSKITALVWVIALIATVLYLQSAYDSTLITFIDKTGLNSTVLLYMLNALVPLGLIAAGNSPRFSKLNESFAQFFNDAGLKILAASVYFSSIIGQEVHSELSFVHVSGIITFTACCLLTATLIIAYGWRHKFFNDQPVKRLGYLFVIVSCLYITLPVLIGFWNISILNAIFVISYSLFLIWLGVKLPRDSLITAGVTMITLRIFILYFEALGGLAMTGFGLIISGAFMILATWAGAKIQKNIRSYAGAGRDDS